MKPVVLVSREISFTFPTAYAYLAGALIEQNEKPVVLFRPAAEAQWPKLVEHICSLNPLLVGFGSLYPELKCIATIIAMLRQAGCKAPMVIGGQMVSPTPEFALQITGADYGVVGEGEITLCKLVLALRNQEDVGTIRGLVIRNGDNCQLTGPGEYLRDLSKLPAIPYELFPVDDWLRVGKWYAEHVPQPHWLYNDRVLSVHGGRGCPHACNFCYHHSPPRYRRIDDMMADAQDGIHRFDANMLYFSDDLVIASPDRARQLLTGLAGLDRRVGFSLSTRCDILLRLDDSVLSGLAEMGCRVMGIGVESGSDRILGIIGKNIGRDGILASVERLARHGIIPTTCIMVGQESETPADVQASIALMKETIGICPNIQYAFSIATPFPGSKLYRQIFAAGLLRDDREFYDRYFADASEWKQVVNLSAMSDAEVANAYRLIQDVYWQEKSRFQGKSVGRLAAWQTKLGRLRSRTARHIGARLPDGATKRFVEHLATAPYDRMQRHLEAKRLKASGLAFRSREDNQA